MREKKEKEEEREKEREGERVSNRLKTARTSDVGVEEMAGEVSKNADLHSYYRIILVIIKYFILLSLSPLSSSCNRRRLLTG